MKFKSFLKKIKSFIKKERNYTNKLAFNTFVLTFFIFLIELIFKMVTNQNIFNFSSIRILIGIICFSLIISYIELFIKNKHVVKINLIIILIISISMKCLLY